MLSRWGHMRVRACLGREAFPSHFAGAPLVAQFSSLGGLDEGWVTAEFTGSLSAGKSAGGEACTFTVDPPPPTHTHTRPPSRTHAHTHANNSLPGDGVASRACLHYLNS